MALFLSKELREERDLFGRLQQAIKKSKVFTRVDEKDFNGEKYETDEFFIEFGLNPSILKVAWKSAGQKVYALNCDFSDAEAQQMRSNWFSQLITFTREYHSKVIKALVDRLKKSINRSKKFSSKSEKNQMTDQVVYYLDDVDISINWKDHRLMVANKKGERLKNVSFVGVYGVVEKLQEYATQREVKDQKTAQLRSGQKKVKAKGTAQTISTAQMIDILKGRRH